MIEMVQDTIQHPDVVEIAKLQVKDLADEHDSLTLCRLSEIAAIHFLVTGMLRYTRDPVNVEWVYDPVAIIKKVKKHGKWSEDCDSYTVLTMALLAAIGHKVRLVLAGFLPHTETYSHVFCEAYVPGRGWTIVDPSLRHKVFVMAKAIKYQKFFYLKPPAQPQPPQLSQNIAR